MKEFSDLVSNPDYKREGPKDRLRSQTMAAICASILALETLRTLCLKRIFKSSFVVLLDCSEAGRIFLKVL